MHSDQKAAAVASYFLERASGRKLNDIKLMKLMYIAERRSLELYSAPIVGDLYVSMEYGPVLSGTLDLMTGSRKSLAWTEHVSEMSRFGKGGDQSVTLRSPVAYESVLRGCDMEILDEVWKRFGGMDKWELRDYCHENFGEYDSRAEQLRTSIPLELATIFSALGDDAELAAEKALEVQDLAG